ncbi:YkgJ family cysteine cluster protein [Infirmifilum lucidum]|uniref:YkgJ family cysteine cluster protein n=1 Tax=Infirmifilum lucidum TaxID=2776706 RepID=A0A7L9FKN8_9CREN|nr:YkgJ family cysteine cluster protein [Infirmifilum lucidum]QOJ79426.1 YkgJ family cysteine cluster protein [Infirmifilum lucidum]
MHIFVPRFKLFGGSLFEHAKCLSCGLCCRNTEMVLTAGDIERLERLGFSREAFVELRGRLPRLRNVNGYCVFYDRRTGRCTVYNYRPSGCRVYPLVFDEERGVAFDPECPLVGEFASRREDIKRALGELKRVLKELETSHGYRVKWRLFYRSARRLEGLETVK